MRSFITQARKNPLPLVLLPGTGCNQLLWQHLLPYFDKQYSLVMPNLFSCRSQAEMVAVIEHQPLIEHQPHQRFALLGFSMGGYLAQACYAKFPERISKLILICSSGEKKITSAEAIERNLAALDHDNYLAQMIDASLPQDRKNDLFQQMRIMLQQVGVEALRQQMLATAERVSYLSLFNPPLVPTLVVGGTQDRVVPRGHIERLASSLEAEVAYIEGGHMLPLEQPDLLGKCLRHWLASDARLDKKKVETAKSAAHQDLLISSGFNRKRM